MSTYEGSYKSQLQGVSQQIARERLDGQVTAQDNMLSDIVTNLRRRPGAAYAYSLQIPNATADSILAWETDIGGQQCHLILNIVDGVVRVLDSAYTLVATLPTFPYLMATTPQDIQVATVGDEFFIANLAKRPALGPPASGVAGKAGFFYVRAGAFSKQYEVTIRTSMATKLYSTTTPDGTGTGDAVAANPKTLAKTLADAINAETAVHGAAAFVVESYVYVKCATATDLKITTSSGSPYLVTSGSGWLRQEADLPSVLPDSAHGYIVATGELKAGRYYSYDKDKQAWLECGNHASPLSITNVPVSVTYTGGAWSLMGLEFEGRLAGDDDSNPNPEFVSRGITGIGNYQGRLVLLSGSLVNLSAAGKPRRFYRSTVTSLLDSDCISVGAAAASSASYRYAVPFGRDLLLFSEKYQAVIPGGQSAISPRTAMVLVTSTYDADMTAKPVTCGRSLMYSAARSSGFFGLLEMLPSSSVEAQYTSYDSTAHLPKYMAGRCRFGVSSSVANMVLFAPSGDRNALIVHEYTWQGDEKVQQAWHRWSFRHKVAAAYFSRQAVHVLFVNNGWLVACTIDPRSGSNTSTGEQRAKLDVSTFADVANRDVSVPTWLLGFDPTGLGSVRLAVASGALAGEAVNCTATGSTLRTDLSFSDGRVCLGFPFTSVVSPTPPMYKDSNGVKVSSNKLTVIRFMLGTTASSEYKVSVGDSASPSPELGGVGTLYYSSSELALGEARVASDSTAVIPARTNADSTSLVIASDGVGELNIVSLEYVARYNEKIRRRG